MRKILQHPEQRAARCLAVAVGELHDLALEAHQLAVEQPIGERNAVARNAETRARAARCGAQIVGASSRQDQPLTDRMLAEKSLAALGSVHQSLKGDRTPVLVERTDQALYGVRQLAARQLVDRRAAVEALTTIALIAFTI